LFWNVDFWYFKILLGNFVLFLKLVIGLFFYCDVWDLRMIRTVNEWQR